MVQRPGFPDSLLKKREYKKKLWAMEKKWMPDLESEYPLALKYEYAMHKTFGLLNRVIRVGVCAIENQTFFYNVFLHKKRSSHCTTMLLLLT